MVGLIRRDMGRGPLSRNGDDSNLGEIFLDLLSHAELNQPVTCQETKVPSSPLISPATTKSLAVLQQVTCVNALKSFPRLWYKQWKVRSGRPEKTRPREPPRVTRPSEEQN